MSLFDNLENILDKTDLDEKLLAKVSLKDGLDAKQLAQIKSLLGKIDIEQIAKKVGVSEDVVKKVEAALK